MDWSSVLGIAISGIFSLTICVITQRAQNKATIDLIEYKLTQLEKEVVKENNLIESLVERIYKCEETIMVLQAQQKGDDGR